jgi:hypothetical protein
MEKYVPLSQRSPDEIRTQAELYREMAATARTPEAKRGLQTLAVRFATLAERRQVAESQQQRSRPVQEVAHSAD